MKNCPTRQVGLSEQRIGDELYVYGANGETLFVLNATAMLIWSLCDGTHSETDMLARLCDLYPDIKPGVLRNDLEDSLRGFREKGLIG